MDCTPLTYLASVKLGSLYNYVDGLQDVPQLQDLNKIIYGYVCNLSDIWIYFFSKIDSLITTIIVFSACRSTFKNNLTLFQSKVWFSLFHQELRHCRLGGLPLACIHIIWGGHGLPYNFNPGLRKLNSRPLIKFLDPVARFANQLNQIRNEEDFVWRPHLDNIPFPWTFSSPPMWIETYYFFRNG